ncbi:MAG: hypothetical protein JSV23_11285 [Promethearchaeota archaeon]|nr:MAG: hypothetical protein JSV23_11285 [Candidatus Lokiarchaeota archaeon]
MSKKENDGNLGKIQNLVIFKTKEDSRSEVIDKYTFEKVDQEDKIKLHNELEPYSGHFRYSILIDNQSLASITEMKIKIKYPEFLTLIRCFPPTINIPQAITEKDTKQIKLEFDELNEKSKIQIHLHFTPNILDKVGEIRTIVTYVNNKDTVRVLDSRPAEIIIDSITIEPKVVPSSFIRKFSQQPGIKNVIKSMGIGIEHQIPSEIYYHILEQSFLFHKFQLVAKDVEKRILWYFGTESKIKQDLLAIGQIVSNKIEIIASSLNPYLLVSFLTLFSNDFKERLLMNGIVNSKNLIYDLECKHCGAVLPYFPNKGEAVECTNCKYEQKIW